MKKPTKREMALLIRALLDLVPNGTYQCRYSLMCRSQRAVDKILGKKKN